MHSRFSPLHTLPPGRRDELVRRLCCLLLPELRLRPGTARRGGPARRRGRR